jgi:hypothetical protein
MVDVPYHTRTEYYTKKYRECIERDEIEEAKEWLSKFEFADPNSDLMNIHPKIRNGKKVIATCDPDREPNEDELIIVYGNYPDWHYAYPYSSKMYRHISFFQNTEHDSVEYHPCWERLDTIYIINLEKRYDRYIDMLLELAKVQAPLHRINHHKVINNTGEPSYINTSRQHVIVQQHFKQSNKNYCLIFEDDFSFISDITHIWKSVELFFNRNYIFEICFLSTSKYHERCEYDDILSYSKQTCTNATGYILCKNTIDTVATTCSEGFELYLQNHNMGYEYCIDQYWRRLLNRFFFKKKLGFQRINLPCNNSPAISGNLD